jgi:hypothetical protein
VTHERPKEARASRHRSWRQTVLGNVGKSIDPPDAYITVSGKRVAVDIATPKRRGTRQGNVVKPHLRFDKVATKLVKHLQATCAATVPDGMMVLLTVTAPIRSSGTGREDTNSSRRGFQDENTRFMGIVSGFDF